MIPPQGHSVSMTGEHLAARGRVGIDAIVLAGSLLLFALIAWQMMPFVPDDSFISYRYAANLAAGHGLRFNPADAPVEGYSNFLWIVLLAAAARAGLDLVVVGVWLGGLFGAASIVLLGVLLRRRGHTGLDLAVPIGLLAVAGPLLLYAISGMETAMFAFLLLAVLFVTDTILTRPTAMRGVALSVVASLAALTRPEGVLALPVVVVGLFWVSLRAAPKRRRALWHALGAVALAFAILQLAYHLTRIAYFDAVWPTPFLSKGMADSGLTKSWSSNVYQFFVRQTHYYAPMGYYYLAIALPAVVAGVLAWQRGELKPLEWIALALAVVFAAVYLNFVDWMPGMRYYAPLVAIWLVPFALLGGQLRATGGRGDAWRNDVAYLLLGATLAIFSLSSLAVLRLDSQQLQAGTQASLEELGHWLRQTMPPDTVLAMSDVGATPYFSGLHTVDINPESLTDRHIAENGWSADYFFAVDPDVVVLTAFSLTKPDFQSVFEDLYAMPRFREAYRRIGITRNDWYQDRSYWVFVRQGETLSPEQLAAFPAGIFKP